MPRWLEALLLNPWLAVAGSVASIAGLIVTWVVWRNVRHLRRAYLTRARVPEQLKVLKRLAKRLSDPSGEPGAAAGATKLDLSELGAILSNLARKLPKAERQKAEKLARRVAGDQRTMGQAELVDVHAELHSLIRAIEESQKDRAWSRDT